MSQQKLEVEVDCFINDIYSIVKEVYTPKPAVEEAKDDVWFDKAAKILIKQHDPKWHSMPKEQRAVEWPAACSLLAAFLEHTFEIETAVDAKDYSLVQFLVDTHGALWGRITLDDFEGVAVIMWAKEHGCPGGVRGVVAGVSRGVTSYLRTKWRRH